MPTRTFSVHALLFLPFLFISVRPQQPDVPLNGTCEPSSNRVDFATRKFLSDCDSRAYCDLSTQPFPTCQPKKCRRDEYPFGYDNGETFPALCASGSFCPDAQNACVPLLSVGSRCELARDEQCSPPPNYRQLVGPRNFNGSVCLNSVCEYSNVTLGQHCIIDNTVYLSVAADGLPIRRTILRDDCATEFYCDGTLSVCQFRKEVGDTCTDDKECITHNCDNLKQLCLDPPNGPIKLDTWVYSLTGTVLVCAILATCSILICVHRRQRAHRTKTVLAYYSEQTTYRNSIIQMHTTARSRRPFSNLYRDPPAPTFSSSPLNWHSPQSDASSIEMANDMNPIIRVQPPSSDGASTFAPSVSTKFTRTSRTENAAWDAQQRQRRN